jgi:hypothetical protein
MPGPRPRRELLGRGIDDPLARGGGLLRPQMALVAALAFHQIRAAPRWL